MRHTALITSILLALSSASFAASVAQMKGSKVLIQLEGDAAEPGQLFYVLDSNGKKKAIVKITQVRGDRAVGEVTKGTALLGGVLKEKTVTPEAAEESPRSSPRKQQREDVQERRSNVSSKRKKIMWGALGGYAMNSMKLTIQDPNNTALKEDANLSDTSFSAKAFMDYDWTPSITFRLASGMETFSAKGTTSATICGGDTTKSCTASFTYLAFEGSAHYNFMTGKTRAWVGLGGSLLMQMSKSVNIPNLNSSTGTNQMLLASAGTDIGLSSGAFIPLVIEYGIFPGASNVTANSIYLRGGYGFSF